MPRVVKSREEFEGEIYESLVLVEGKDLPVPPTGTEFVEIAHSRRRIDGAQRVTGRARYTQDIYLPGMLHVRVLRSPYPRARVRRIDTKKAEALPGVRGVLHRFNAPKAAFRGEETIFRDVGRRAAHGVRVHATRLRCAAGTPRRAEAALLQDPGALRLHGWRLRLEGRCWQVLDHRVALHDATRAPGPMRPHSRRRKSRGGKPLGHIAAAPRRGEGRAHHGA